ncbi:hypothetical protein [Acaryochloris sp. IP29b_bin.148]|uniref:hypothetical protein n=1 Tax=Acaryochloris sp. IP29b_bin.148 TaxID=2969218 RepID=UPI002638816D|nr:hypothetical protein [Acaryochloris sp. IP29b_bin.148]
MMNYSADEIYRAARAIQPYLADLVNAPSAQRLERKLEGLLSESALKQGSDRELSQLLSEHESTQDWIRLYLEESYPAEDILKALRIYYPLPGIERSVESPRYVCPVEKCNQDWYRQNRDAEIPVCPVHGIKLIIDS